MASFLLRTGDTVRIDQEPITRESLEAEARVKRIDEVEFIGEYAVVTAQVEFLSQPGEIYTRRIRVS